MNKKRRHFSLFGTVMFVVLFIWSASIIILMGWALLSSLKSQTDFLLNPLGFPRKLVFSNYTNIFRDLNVPVTEIGVGQRKIFLPELFFNSLLYSVGCTVVYILSKAMVAYVVARYKFWLGPILYTVNIIVMVLPVVGRLPGELQLMRLLGFYDNVWALMIMRASFTGMDFMLFHATFASISKDYSDAATIDGASQFTIMFQIIFPMAKQIIYIISLSNFITYWNNWDATITYMPNFPTAAYALYIFQNSNLPEIALGGIPYIFSACTVVMLPILIIFVIFRDQIMGEINFSGIKG